VNAGLHAAEQRGPKELNLPVSRSVAVGRYRSMFLPTVLRHDAVVIVHDACSRPGVLLSHASALQPNADEDS
jgi:hypothetical protein